MIKKINNLKNLISELEGTNYKEEILKSCTKNKIAYTSDKVNELLKEKLDIMLNKSSYSEVSEDISKSVSNILKLIR